MKTRIITGCVLVILAGTAIFLARSKKPTAYRNPVDNKSYVADWKEYEPETPPTKPPNTRIYLKNVRLLDEQDTFSRNIDVQDLSDYVQRIEHSISNALKSSDTSYELLIQCTLGPISNTFEMASNGKVSKDELQRVFSALKTVTPVHSKSDPLGFQMDFQINRTP